jgi:hypothetical protein
VFEWYLVLLVLALFSIWNISVKKKILKTGSPFTDVKTIVDWEKSPNKGSQQLWYVLTGRLDQSRICRAVHSEEKSLQMNALKLLLCGVSPKPKHTSVNFITMLVTRAMSNSSKNRSFLMYWIWKMGRNLFPLLDIRDNLKVAYLGKNLVNPSICLVTGSVFMELSSLCYCFTV